jgi:hypothetical protein
MDCLALWAEIVEKVGPFVYCDEPVVNSKKPLPAGSGQAPGPAADKGARYVSEKNCAGCGDRFGKCRDGFAVLTARSQIYM